MKRCILLLSISLLSACSLLGNAAKEGVISAAGYPSFARFTLEGSLPADYAFKYTAYYQPERPAACTFYSPSAGGEVPRKHIEQAETETRAEPQQFSYRIPLSYHEAGCEMKLVNVDLLAFATYGARDSEFGRDGGSLRVYGSLPESVPHFSESGVRELRGKCMWLFRVIGKSNRLRKILACHKADEHWQVPQDYDKRSGVGASLRRDELDGKTVRVEFQQSEEEQPSVRDTWIKTSGGWKPCLGDGVDDPYGFCDTQTQAFRTFQMNGRECTVYPNCTE
ncbi:MAG: hypothetical protein ACRCTL_03300 [Pseudomonas sp.]